MHVHVRLRSRGHMPGRPYMPFNVRFDSPTDTYKQRQMPSLCQFIYAVRMASCQPRQAASKRRACTCVPKTTDNVHAARFEISVRS